ncbi:MAG: glutamyl-tRNA reductase [Bradymonadaceae bacterium]|nr:glutamyl-tRNA reductase [Lujinxingiaceae bacterium]
MAANLELNCFSFSHQNTDLAQRDALSFTKEQIELFVAASRMHWALEAAVLSTCNRTEFYLFGPARPALWEDVRALIATIRALEPSAIPRPAARSAEQAARHIFRVSASLESLALGENQILSQIKDVHEQILLSPGKSPVLERLFQFAIRAGKQVRTQTDLCTGSLSIGSAAVDLALKIFENFQRRQVLIVGAGETAETTAAHFTTHGAESFVVTNRGQERGRALATTLRAPFRPLDELPAALESADVAVFATGSTDFLINRVQMKKVMKARKHRAIFVIDISNPRNVEPDVGKLDGVFLYNIDDLEHVVAANLASRQGEIPAAEAVVQHMVNEWQAWHQAMEITPTIASLARFFEQVREQELSRHNSRLTDQERVMLEEFSRGLIKKLLHNPITYLKSSVENKTLRKEDLNLVWALYNLQREEQTDET